MKTFVIASKRRLPLVQQYLNQEDTILYTPDYPSPGRTQLDWLNPNALGAYRCYRGHQNAAQAVLDANVPYALILEDDACPYQTDKTVCPGAKYWRDICQEATKYLDDHEIVSLHSRNVVYKKPIAVTNDYGVYELEEHVRDTWSGKPYAAKWALGSLAYLISQGAAKKFTQLEWIGLPSDLVIANNFTFCYVDPSPFEHNRSQRSLVEGAGKR